jgi:hypothetical protein
MDKKTIIVVVVAVAIVIVAAGIYGMSKSNETKSVTYNGNGGTYNGETTVTNDSNVVMYCEFTNGNYTFDSWNTKADGTGTSYNMGGTVDYGMVLYAQWSYRVNPYDYSAEGISSFATIYINDNVLEEEASVDPSSQITISDVSNCSYNGNGIYYCTYDDLKYKVEITISGDGLTGTPEYNLVSGVPTITFDTTDDVGVSVDVELIER